CLGGPVFGVSRVRAPVHVRAGEEIHAVALHGRRRFYQCAKACPRHGPQRGLRSESRSTTSRALQSTHEPKRSSSPRASASTKKAACSKVIGEAGSRAR